VLGVPYRRPEAADAAVAAESTDEVTP
jgi:hypothetical protein